jgi:hypothetical protein
VQRHAAEAVDAAYHRGVAETGFDKLVGVGERLRARGASGRERQRRPLQAERVAHEPRHRKHVVCMLVLIAGRQRPGRGISALEGVLALQNAGRARAEDYGDSIRSVARSGRSDGGGKAVRRQGQRRQAIVPAVVTAERGGARRFLEARDSPDIAVEPNIREIALSQSAATFAQRAPSFLDAAPHGTDGGVGR